MKVSKKLQTLFLSACIAGVPLFAASCVKGIAPGFTAITAPAAEMAVSSNETNRIIVKFTEATAQALAAPPAESIAVRLQLSGMGIAEVQSLGRAGLTVFRNDNPSKPIEAVIADLEGSGMVEYAEPDYPVHALSSPDDPGFPRLWGLDNSTNDADLDAPEAWDIQQGDASVVVAVIDTGVDYEHEDLAANIWKNRDEVAGNGRDDDGNGYIDDVHGIDVVGRDGDPLDDNSHGTHVSGTIGAVGNNRIGVAGVCWQVRIMALKFLDSNGSGYVSGAIECIDYAIANGATILNNSWGGGKYSKSLADAIARAEQAGVLFVAAAGNSAANNDILPTYPASYENENIIVVASFDSRDQISYFSNYGKKSVDVAAPGTDILSTIPGNGYAFYSGTSMATPHVTGLAALVKSANPSFGCLEIKQRILSSVEKTSSLTGKVLTDGRINAYNAVRVENAPQPPTVNITAPLNLSVVKGEVSILAKTGDVAGVARVEFYIDDVFFAGDELEPYGCSWNTKSATNGPHHIRAVAVDADSLTSADSISVTVDNTAPVDTVKPLIVITAPSACAQVVESLVITAAARDNIGVNRVVFMIDSIPLETDYDAPYTATWDTFGSVNGNHLITVTAYDDAGNATSKTISVTVANPVTGPGPSVAIQTPGNNARVRGDVSVVAAVTPATHVRMVRFYIDDDLVCTDTASPYAYTWQTGVEHNGAHRIKAMAYDTLGRKGKTVIRVYLRN